jgi:hypothetical protein
MRVIAGAQKVEIGGVHRRSSRGADSRLSTLATQQDGQPIAIMAYIEHDTSWRKYHRHEASYFWRRAVGR